MARFVVVLAVLLAVAAFSEAEDTTTTTSSSSTTTTTSAPQSSAAAKTTTTTPAPPAQVVHKAETFEKSFPKITNLKKITWDQRVQSYQSLVNSTALTSDIIAVSVTTGEFSPVAGSMNQPIITNGTGKKSDLHLDNFLTSAKVLKKSVKLHCDSESTFNKTVDHLKNESWPMSVIVHADVAAGPGVDPKTEFAGSKILEKSSQYPSAILSLGWATNSVEAKKANSTYTNDHVTAMTKVIQSKLNENVTSKTNVTFVVHAVLLTSDVDPIKKLFNETAKLHPTLTVVSRPGQTVDQKTVREAIKKIGARVFLEVPEDLRKHLASSSVVLQSALSLVIVSLLVSFFNK